MKNILTRLIKYILGYCSQCNKWFKYPTMQHIGTAYMQDEFNYITCCNECHDEIQDYIDEQWREYYSERGC